MTENHVNPGTDVTVSPPGLVIDDSYRSRKNMKAPAKTTAWGIRMPFAKEPYIFVFSIRRTRKEAIKDFLYEPMAWKRYYRNGYRCVKVNVEEIS
jgi:hypothetical protein